MLDEGVEGLSTPSEDAGPAVAEHHVVAEMRERNERTDTRSMVVHHVAVVNVRSSVFTKNTFKAVPHSEVRHFRARGSHDSRTITATVDNSCQRIFAFQDHTHHQSDVFVIGAARYLDGIASIGVAESVANLLEFARHVDNPCHGGSGKKQSPGRNEDQFL